MGETAGHSMAVAASLIDGIIVIGGGITAARHLMIDAILKELRDSVSTLDGTESNAYSPKYSISTMLKNLRNSQQDPVRLFLSREPIYL